MFCSHCGKVLPAGAASCTGCGARATLEAKPSAWAPVTAQAATATGAPRYAGFWLRFLAEMIDTLVIEVAGLMVVATFALLGGVAFRRGGSSSVAAAVEVAALLVSSVGWWLYYALMESSGRQATLGKLALGLAVTDADGRAIGFGRATGRYFGKLVSYAPLGVGLVIAAFTARKQALHDLMAGTLVVRRRDSGVPAVVAAAAASAVGTTAILGVMAAIAIPSFLRFQLRAKAAEAPALIASLAAAEAAYFARNGQYLPLRVPADGKPGVKKMTWSRADRAAAASLGWEVDGASFFTYRVATGKGEDGKRTLSICAEADLDGDRNRAAVVLWLPSVDPWGHPATSPPAPPCADAPAATRSLTFAPDDPIGEPVRVTPDDVF